MSIFQTTQKDGTVNRMICGYVTKDARLFDKLIIFSVCYAKGKYTDCKVWRSDEMLADIASCLEKHDVVMVAGRVEVYKEHENVVADFIMPLGLMPQAENAPRPVDSPVTVDAEDFDDGSGTPPWESGGNYEDEEPL